MPRPSSPLNAKASVRSPYALDRSQQNSCVGTVCPPAVRTAEETPTHALCALMSSRVCPPSFRGSRANPSINNVSVQPGPRPGRKTCLLTIAIASGGARRDRTDDLMLAKHALYQLSYGPNLKPARLGACHRPVRPRITQSVVGPGRLELPTSRLSGVCSNQLSYRP